jgi:multiple sugar transport system permease protein
VREIKVRGRKKRHWYIPFLFLLPHLAVFCCFNLLPSLAGIYAAFTKWDLGQAPQWIGLTNLKTIFTDQSSLFYWELRWGLRNTCLFVLLAVPFRIIVPLLLATALNTKCPGYKLYQTIFYLPALLSLSVVMGTWNYMFNTNYGIINNFFGLKNLSWTNTVPLNWIAIIIITVWWGTGSNMVIYQAALAGIPADILEASRVDGANCVKRFFHIILPAMKYPVSYTLAISIIAEFNVWGQPGMFNKGGPVVEIVNGYARNSNMMLMQYIKDAGFQGAYGSNPGIASAMALVLGCIMVVVSLIQVHLMQKNSQEE